MDSELMGKKPDLAGRYALCVLASKGSSPEKWF